MDHSPLYMQAVEALRHETRSYPRYCTYIPLQHSYRQSVHLLENRPSPKTLYFYTTRWVYLYRCVPIMATTQRATVNVHLSGAGWKCENVQARQRISQYDSERWIPVGFRPLQPAPDRLQTCAIFNPFLYSLTISIRNLFCPHIVTLHHTALHCTALHRLSHSIILGILICFYKKRSSNLVLFMDAFLIYYYNTSIQVVVDFN